MSEITIEVEIKDGRIVPLDPEKLPMEGRGRLTVEVAGEEAGDFVQSRPGGPKLRVLRRGIPGHRVSLPIIEGTPGNVIDPSPEELDRSFWGD